MDALALAILINLALLAGGCSWVWLVGLDLMLFTAWIMWTSETMEA